MREEEQQAANEIAAKLGRLILEVAKLCDRLAPTPLTLTEGPEDAPTVKDKVFYKVNATPEPENLQGPDPRAYPNFQTFGPFDSEEKLHYWQRLDDKTVAPTTGPAADLSELMGRKFRRQVYANRLHGAERDVRKTAAIAAGLMVENTGLQHQVEDLRTILDQVAHKADADTAQYLAANIKLQARVEEVEKERDTYYRDLRQMNERAMRNGENTEEDDLKIEANTRIETLQEAVQLLDRTRGCHLTPHGERTVADALAIKPFEE